MTYSQRRLGLTAIPVTAVLSMALALMAHGATIKFDQSQTGDYNLQIHLKNIELYAVFDDSGGSDDEYGDLPDYTDPTDTPSKPPAAAAPSASASTTNAPSSPAPPPVLSSTTAASVVTGSSAAATSSASSAALLLDPYSPSNSDKIVQMVEALIASNGNTSDMPVEPLSPSTSSSSSAQQQQQSPSAPPSSPMQQQQQSPSPAAVALAAASASNNSNRKCGPGYFRDPMGRCRRIRKPHLPFLQMVHTPGVIKSFQPQQRTAEDDSTSKN